MTVERIPGTFEAAIDDIAAFVGGYPTLASMVDLSESMIRRWSNPADPKLPNVRQSLALDTAYMERGGERPPMLAVHEGAIEAVEAVACRRVLAAQLAEVITENGDAMAAIVPLTQGNPSRQQIYRARREIGQALNALGRIGRTVSKILSTGGQMPGGAQ